MPVAADLPCVYPETLLDESPPSAWDRRWWVMYTKVHQEKTLAEQLFAYEIPYYLPLVPKASNRRGRRVVSRVPMFAGYVFLFGSEEERVRGLTTNRISRVLYVDDLDRLSHDLRQLQRLINCA